MVEWRSVRMDTKRRHGLGSGKMLGPQFLIMSTQGGVRSEDGSPIALGYHTGHWEVGLLVRAAAEWISEAGGVPFAGFVSDPCDGRTQGTTGMFDSLPYRNDAAIVFRRLIRSLPTRRGVLGIATCDKGPSSHDDCLGGHGVASQRDCSRWCHLAGEQHRRLGEGSDDRCPLCSRRAFVRGCSRCRLSSLWIAWRRMSVLGNGGHLSSGRGSARHDGPSRRSSTERAAHLA